MYMRTIGPTLAVLLLTLTSHYLYAQSRWRCISMPTIATAQPRAVLPEPDGHLLVASDAGLFRVSAELDTVELLGFPGHFPDRMVTGIARSPQGSLFAALYESDCSYDGGAVYRSTDNGASWCLVFNEIVECILAVPDGAIVLVTQEHCLVTSINDGISWRYPTDSLSRTIERACILSDSTLLVLSEGDGAYRYNPRSRSFTYLTTLEGIHRMERRTDGTIVAGEYGKAMLVSTNGGSTWSRAVNDDVDDGDEDYDQASGYISHTVLAVDARGRKVTAIEEHSGKGSPDWFLGIATPDGVGLKRIPLGFPREHNLAMIPGAGILDGTDRKLYRCGERGQAWESVDSEDFLEQWTAPVQYDGSVLLAGTEKGLYLSRDAGRHWEQTPLKNNYIDRIRLHPVYGVFAIGNGRVNQSNDGTEWWPRYINAGESIKDVLHPGGGVVLVSTYYGLYRSTDNGDTWTKDSTINIGTDVVMEHMRNGMIVAASGSSFYSSDDDGLTWTTGSFVPRGDTLCYACETVATFAAGDSSEVSFTCVYDEEQLYMETVAIMEGPRGEIVVASDNGLFRSVDGGRKWERVYIPGPMQKITSVTFDTDGALIIGLERGPVYVEQLEKPAAAAAPVHEAVALDAAPNPAREHATISFTLSERDDVTLDVYDAYGTCAAVLASGTLAPGTHTFRFPQSAGVAPMPSGVYTLRLVTSAGLSTRRIVLMR